MTKFFLAIHFIFLIIFTKSKADICDECEAAIYIPHETQPVLEVQLLVNQTLAVQCRISTVTHGCDSSYLFFRLSNKKEFLRDVKTVDNSTIELYMQDVPQMNDLLTCQYVNKALKKVCGLSQIGVRAGYQPKITNFSCISVDLEMMKCTIEQIRNPLTNYFSILYGPSDGTNTRRSPHPNNPLSATNASKISFDVPGFAYAWDFYYFQIVVKNVFGETNETYWVDVKQGAFRPVIQSLSVTPIILKSAILYWSIPVKYEAIYKMKHFKHNVSISRKSDVSTENLWRKIDAKNTKKINETTFELKIKLDYAYTEYDVQVSTCVEGALYEYLWSDPKHYTFQTLKQNPDSPPEIPLGGFEILSNSETKIHWKEIPKAKWNADYMNVKIVEVMKNGVSVHLHQPDYYSTTAKFHGLQHATNDYQFKIISVNSEGPSNEYSVINIPREVRRIAYPNNLKKVLSNSVYTLTWEWDSSQSYTPDNYTIFVCDPIDEQEDLCGKLLDFDYVNFNAGNTFIYNNTHDGKPKKIFAISSNRNDQTSGMLWFPCTNTEYQEMTEFPAELQVLGPNRMNVTWNTQCAALHTGINISYCPIYNESVTECDETPLYAAENLNYHVIENLDAYTTYRVRISMFKGNKSGPPVSLNTTTKSSKPTVPYDLSCAKKSNTSITITWKPPHNWNGREKSYNIYYKLINSTNHQYVENYKSINVTKRNGIYLPYTFQLGNLLSYSTYTIQIAACNTDWCSDASNEITIKTDVGKPDKIIGFSDSTGSGHYAWNPPQYKAGKLDFYEIKFEAKNKDTISTFEVIKKIFMNSTKCTLVNKISLCPTNTEVIQISVRPINIVPLDGEVNDACCMDETENSNYNEFDSIKCVEEMHHRIKFDCSAHHNCLAGDWFPFGGDCLRDSNVMATILIASFCIGLGMLIGLSMVCKKFQQIKDVGDPELPSGMENLLDKKPLHRNKLMYNKPSGNLKGRLISESKSVDSCNTYMDNGHFIDEINYSSNSDYIAENILSSKQSITNLLNLTQSIIPYECEIEAKPILNYTLSSNTSNYEYDGESLNHSETISYDSTQSMNDSRMFSGLTETTNTESDGITQTAAPCPIITSNGYVQVRDIPPPKPPIFVASTGYVCVSDLPNQNVNVINNSKLMERNILWPVNGYVKPQHLAGFESNRGAI